MQCVVFTGAGGGEVVDVQERPDPVPGSGEVLVRVRYAGLNPADLHQRAGHYPAPPGSPPDIPGLEVSGTVAAVGDQVLGYRPGDRVFGLVGGGGCADRVAVHERCVARVPDNLEELDAAAVPEAFITAHDAIRTRGRLVMGETLLVHGANGGVGSAALQIGVVAVHERCVARVPDNLEELEAAAVPEAFITAHDAIRTRGRLVMGETLLVHGANGGVGSAALQIGVVAGARVYGVVRSEQAEALVRELGAEPVQDDAFADEVKADVILELVGAPHFPGNLKALNPRGRIVVVGTGAGSSAQIELGMLMGKRAEMHGTVLRARSLEDKGQALRAFEREVVPHLASGRMRPLVDRVYEAARARDAYDRLAGSGKAGKVLLDFGG